ncbi:uncharacterized protein PGTG_10424 [Puccinia graminis f. sp. tritici CRL 75-36-700-3]|uniref:No apical meristem-associated C-terminal domain-containing protein n=1 Tax=Puccinia graminis f. sp. tritici (strain CRL 75-36-700-3 / race SCCL) TaxID=418459 RepID=E3KKX8_PUCGT|nr:uncharacterized protein PGTG_10424 [Puccinia graminis f. sp. tritici CRL 75-36-700-3]EFP84953.2 hypothetical protein PGTG_10424 [Puccinia graminis f. sp. tritici CRL 75-36-700-3]
MCCLVKHYSGRHCWERSEGYDLLVTNPRKSYGTHRCYSNAKRWLKSGKTRNDILTEAKALYITASGSPFNLDHCWGILKDTPKWQATQRENDARGKKAQVASTTSLSTDLPSSSIQVSSPAVIDID